MLCQLPGWLGPRRPNRTRTFILIKLALFIGLVVASIETLLNGPFVYKILKETAMKYPVGEKADTNIIALSTVLSLALVLSLLAIGFIGVLKENASVMVAFACIFTLGIIATVYFYNEYTLVIIAAIIDLVFVCVSLFYAYLIVKLNKRL